MSFESLIGVFEREIETQRLPGAVLWVARGERPLLCRALGRLDPQGVAPMSEDAIFRIYSMTKPVTSVALLMLLEEGRVRLDEPVATYLPDYAHLNVGSEEGSGAGRRLVMRRARHAMTIRDLLRHTAGLTYGYFERSLVKDEYIRSGVESRRLSNRQFAAALAKLPLAYEPGTTWEYSRATDLLGALIEELCATTLGAFLQERIFGPLGMVDTAFWVPPGKQHRVAEPYRLDPDTGEPVRLIDVREAPVFESGGGGLVSTVADYARFQSMLRGEGRFGATQILEASTVGLMTRDHLEGIARGPMYLPGPDYGFGLGVAVRLASSGTGAPGEYFWGGLAGTFQWVDPRHDLTAILMVQAPNQREALRALFYEHVYAGLRSAA
jgi:CubicO group peptidase (beta-lactamase class C family)